MVEVIGIHAFVEIGRSFDWDCDIVYLTIGVVLCYSASFFIKFCVMAI